MPEKLLMSHAKVIGKKILHFLEVPSTNDIAKELAFKGEPEGTVVIADMQTAGRGRLSRQWYSPHGGLYLSIILRPALKPSEATRIIILSAVAVAKTIRQYSSAAHVKWPNDVLIGEKKVCGILTELVTTGDSIDFIIVGIGVNVNTDIPITKDLLIPATSLKSELKKDVSMPEFVERLLTEFDRLYQKRFDAVLKLWRNYSCTLGRKVRIESFDTVYEGKALDIDDLGRLVLLDKNGKKITVSVGDCIHAQNCFAILCHGSEA